MSAGKTRTVPNRPNVKQVRWVKSHRTLDQATSAEERQEIQRNDEVDALAKAALQCHDDDTWEWAETARQTGKDVDDCPDNWSHACSLAQVGPCGVAPRPPTAVRRVDSNPTDGLLNARPGAVHYVPEWQKEGANTTSQLQENARTCTTLNTTTVFGSKRKVMGTSSGERSMGPLLSSVAHAGWCMRRLAQKCKGRPACDLEVRRLICTAACSSARGGRLIRTVAWPRSVVGGTRLLGRDQVLALHGCLAEIPRWHAPGCSNVCAF